MNWSFVFFTNSILLGIGLAMDAFSVSLANGLHEPKMKIKKACEIAGTFSLFQALMPMTGWICVHTISQYFKVFEKMIPWIALVLLSFIGGKMLLEGLNHAQSGKEAPALSFSDLLMQGIATSIDALSVGFTISDYGFVMALVCSLIIAAVTFVICVSGVFIGKKFGTKLSNKASILGGTILIFIGIEILVKGIL